MALAWIVPIFMTLGIATYLGLYLAASGISMEQGAGLILGLVVGGLLTFLIIARVRYFLSGNDMSKATLVMMTSFMTKLAGLAFVGGVIYVTGLFKNDLSVVSPDPIAAFGAYLSCIFFGYAWQAKLVQGRHRLQGQMKSKTQETSERG